MKANKDIAEGQVRSSTNYGSYKIISIINMSRIIIKFETTGGVRETRAGQIRRGAVKDLMHVFLHGLGFLGGSKYRPRGSEIESKAYNVWRGIFDRCYNEKRRHKHPTYINCIVCNEWRNFQTFAKWYIDNYPTDGAEYQIDKDLLSKGREIYSPDTCCFLTAQENTEYSQAMTYSFISPSGEIVKIFNMNKFCRENNLDNMSMNYVALGKYRQHKGWHLHGCRVS